jgi:hypothetical protein
MFINKKAFNNFKEFLQILFGLQLIDVRIGKRYYEGSKKYINK